MTDNNYPPRSSSGSGRPSSSRTRSAQQSQSQQQLSQIEKGVTQLLVATKQLLETLTMWSRGAASETDVSDVYVRLGYEFNIACRTFNNFGVETSDLGPVPDLLRTILEDTLSQDATQASLDKYLPRIRDIIINLLQGLKKKQNRLRQRTAAQSAQSSSSSSSLPRESSSTAVRQTSIASTSSTDTTMTQTLEDAVRRQQAYPRSTSSELTGQTVPPRTASVQSQSSRQSPRREPQASSSSRPRDAAKETHQSTPSSTLVENTQKPLPDPFLIETQQSSQPVELSTNPQSPLDQRAPIQTDALAELQRGGDLERRASRRFSAYQISKHLGGSSSVANIIPPSQNSPIPNRGREARDSMNAVRTRSGYNITNRSRSAYRINQESSPLRKEQEGRVDSDAPNTPGSPEKPRQHTRTPEGKQLDFTFPADGSAPAETTIEKAGIGEPTPITNGTHAASAPALPPVVNTRIEEPPVAVAPFIPESSPQPGKELTLFLQYKSKIKKHVLPDAADLTMARLQLAFIERFAWNTHNNGVDLPDIYIQDPVSGVRHELEDLSDVKDRSVLALNVEALEEVKRHFDDGVDGLKRMMDSIKSVVDGQQVALQRVSDRQQETAKEIAGIAAAPPPPTLPSSSSKAQLAPKDAAHQLSEVQALRRDLAVVRQTYSSFVADMDSSMTEIRTKAGAVRAKALDVSIPIVPPDSGRTYVNNGKKTLQEDSEKIVTSVDDLQDIVEDLRKDVVTRGVRPLARQLETVSKEISSATTNLKKLQEFIRREKPIWTKIWERELQVVCDDREILTMQEDLCIDLEDDLEKAANTFALVEQATRQQNLDNAKGPVRSTSRTLNPLSIDQNADPLKAKDGVLGEVKALRPNHETRLEAIERAEKARQKELEGRKDDGFSKELGMFVEEGKLKKSGGVEEVERLRKVKDERAIRGYYERIAARNGGGAAPAEAPAATGSPSGPNGGSAEVSSLDDASSGEYGSTSSVTDTQNGGVSPDADFVEAREQPLGAESL